MFVRWLVALLIVILPVGAMLLRRRRPALVRRAGGLSGMLGGAIWLYILLRGVFLFDTLVAALLLPPLLLALSTVGLASLWPAATGRRAAFGRFTLWFSMLGAIALALSSVLIEWFGNEDGWLFILLGILAHTIGLFLFGLVNLKSRSLRRWNALPSVVGLFSLLVPITLVLVSAVPESSDLPLELFIGILGGGWVLMGGLLLFSQTPEEAADPNL